VVTYHSRCIQTPHWHVIFNGIMISCFLVMARCLVISGSMACGRAHASMSLPRI
jgi:hypothetical protein